MPVPPATHLVAAVWSRRGRPWAGTGPADACKGWVLGGGQGCTAAAHASRPISTAYHSAGPPTPPGAHHPTLHHAACVSKAAPCALPCFVLNCIPIVHFYSRNDWEGEFDQADAAVRAGKHSPPSSRTSASANCGRVEVACHQVPVNQLPLIAPPQPEEVLDERTRCLALPSTFKTLK